VIPPSAPSIDSRDTNAVLAEFQNRQRGFLPRWNPPTKSSGAAMGPIFARLINAILERLNRVPAKEKLAFLDFLGIRLIAAQPARAPIVFSLSSGAADTMAPEGTQVAAPPPPGSTNQIVFSTEEDAAVAAAALTELVSFWPGRDQYINHSAALQAGQPFTLFQDMQLAQTDHILYLAHSLILGFAGNVTLKIIFDLSQGSSSPLDIVWEYWDGQVWRTFLSAQSSCFDAADMYVDGTNGLSTSGTVQLQTQGAQTAQTAVNGVASYWIRARLAQALPTGAVPLLPEAQTIRLLTQIDQSLEATGGKATFITSPNSFILPVDQNGNSLVGVTLTVQDNTSQRSFTSGTDQWGRIAFPAQLIGSGDSYKFTATYSNATASLAESITGPFPAEIILTWGMGSTSPTLTFTTVPSAIFVVNEVGSPLSNAYVSISIQGSSAVLAAGATDSRGCLPVDFALTQNTTYVFAVTYNGATLAIQQLYAGPTQAGGASPFQIVLSLQVLGLRLDKAMSDGNTLDVSKAFYPLGLAPLVGTTFYFKQAEAFSKPGATVRLYIDAVPAGLLPANTSPLGHVVTWEYWNGWNWTLLYQDDPTNPNDPLGDFTVSEVVEFTIPPDLRLTTVNNDQGYWMRARVLSGKFGYLQSITIPAVGGGSQTITYPVVQAPVVADIRIGYIWTQGPYALEQVFTYNDFQFVDHTSNALFPGNPFTPYQPVSDVTPTVYLGFNKLLPVDNYGVYLDIVEQQGVEAGPAMIWEYWNGGWESVSEEDETQALALPGMITFLPAADATPLARFDNPLYWLRGRLKEDQPPNETTIINVYTNAVWALQYQTFQYSPLGASTGVPNQLFQFNQIPILAGQEIEVQESSGPRANTEWRTIAIQVVPNDPNIVTELEALLAAEGPQTDIILGNVHLVRDKTKSVTAVWIQWQELQNFFVSGPSDRVYVLDHAMGRLFFGDGDAGMIPPLGAAIQATSFQSGGGLAGNVAAATITQLLGSLAGVSGVTNPRAAEGGADGETLEGYQSRAPLTVSDRGRAIVAQDYETMAHEASAGVAVTRAMGPLDPSGRPVPGWVTLMIIPQSTDPRPVPSAGLRQDVLNYLLSRAPADVVAAQRINVIGPTYLPVDVKATVAPMDPAQAGTVEQDAIAALAAFLNPLTGGPQGLGWDVGRGLYASDIATTLGDVDGVDYVEALGLYVNGVLQGEQVQVPTGQIVVAGELEISLVLPATY
jgi:baseplate J-like protein